MTPKRTGGVAVAAFILIITLLVTAAPAVARGPHSIKLMTRNEYIGADLSPLILAKPEDFMEVAQEVLTQIAANNFPRRALGIAREVFLTRPDVIGMQEVFDISVNGQHPGPPFVDHRRPRSRRWPRSGSTTSWPPSSSTWTSRYRSTSTVRGLPSSSACWIGT